MLVAEFAPKCANLIALKGVNKMYNLMIVGVGGQGTLLASRLLGYIMTEEGLDVKVSEVHGMSQRGGSVVTYVKAGKTVNSPIITEGEADIILAFEQLEAARFIKYLKKQGKIILNTQKIMPMPVVTGNAKYPEDVIEKLNSTDAEIITLDALSLANQAGSSKAVNVVLIGVLAKNTDIAKEKWIDAIKATVPPKFLEMNLKAFELGYNQ